MNLCGLVLVVVLCLFGGAITNLLLFGVVALPCWLLRRVQHLHRQGRPAAALLVLVAQLGAVSLYCAVLSPWNIDNGVLPAMPSGPGVGAGIAASLLYLAWFGLAGAEIIGLAVLAAGTQQGRSRLVILSLLGAMGCGYGAWMVGGCPGLHGPSSAPKHRPYYGSNSSREATSSRSHVCSIASLIFRTSSRSRPSD